MSTDSQAAYEFRKQVEALEKFSGRGTQLISVYVTPGYQISEIAAKLRDEAGQAANIKSTSTRKNVISALEKILQYLKQFKEPPRNGIAIFCGDVSETEGKPDIKLFSVIPPTPIGVQFYRCESRFVLEPLKEMLDKAGTYGIVVMDGKEATIAVLKGKQVKIIRRLNSTAHAKVHKGGQSAQRYNRLHDEAVEFYYKRVGEAMDPFLEYKGFEGVIVGGPGPAKEDFLKQKSYNYQTKILGVVDTGYTDEYGIQEVIEKSGEIIAEQEAVKEKKLLDEFMAQVMKGGGLATYGEKEVKAAAESGQASKLLVSEGLALNRIKLSCTKCGKTVEKVVERVEEYQNAPCGCGGVYKVAEEHDIVGEIVDLAEKMNIPIEFISKETSAGFGFYGTFRGLGAFLRYK
jgi:peptide chain release factor subunit 1